MSFRWLLYIAAQAVVVALSILLSVWLAPSLWAIMPAVFGVWFAWRTLNHPDLVYRRLVAVAVFAAIGLLGLTQWAKIQVEIMLKSGIEVHWLVARLSADGDTGGIALLVASFALGLLDVLLTYVRSKTDQANTTGSQQVVSAYGKTLVATPGANDEFRMRGTFQLVQHPVNRFT